MGFFAVGGWTEEEARAQFIAFRWAEFGGQPRCTKCGCEAVNRYHKRPIYKCKRCYTQFSDTSGTPWQRRKLSFRKLMGLLSMVVHNKGSQTILGMAEQLEVQYKTAFLWVQKIREEIALRAKAQVLSGEVEIDGAYFGGYVRPKNQKKTRRDLRKIPYRDNDRKLSVVAARQRGGGIITYVAKNEPDARRFIAKDVLAGSTLFSDMAPGWKPLRGRFQLFQVDHSTNYSTPEACTNGVETIWSRMRVMERNSRHIAQNYLDLYAADAAWMMSKTKKAKGEAFQEVMTWMSRAGRSPLSGYFQGRKRTMMLCELDGTTSEWRPRPRRGRTVFIKNDGEPVAFVSRKPLKRTWRDGFTFMSAADFVADPEAIPNGPGVYGLFVKPEADLIGQLGYDLEGTPWSVDGNEHYYTGETYGLRGRLLDHLQGDVRSSNPRQLLLALQMQLGRLEPSVAENKDETERRLNEWLADHVVVGFKSCGYVKDVERTILEAVASPLNLARPNITALTRQLQDDLRAFRSQVMTNWPNTPSAYPRRRR